MTQEQFEERQGSSKCRVCQSSEWRIVDAPPPHNAKVECVNGHWWDWLREEKNEDRRPRLKPGELDRIWSEYGNVCACCNMGAEDLEYLQVERTHQHVPAYKQVGDAAKKIPFCGWCQARSAAEMRRMETLLKRLRKRDVERAKADAESEVLV